MAQVQTKQEFYPGDEVCMIRDGHLAFGILTQKKIQNSLEAWKIGWNYTVNNEINLASNLTLTHRPLYVGCKVRRRNEEASPIGLCRNVSLFADLRLVGTNTILESINISDFTHLKEFNQKSVVYLDGWLGIITHTERTATVALPNKQSIKVPLSEIHPPNLLMVDLPWISEIVKSKISRSTKLDRYCLENPVKGISGSSCRTLFLKDLEVESVKVSWRHQIDLMCPDPPRCTLEASRLLKLKLVTEESGADAAFQVGNLGRYKLSVSNELIGFEEYERNFVKKYLPCQLTTLDRTTRAYPDRAYLENPEEVVVPEKLYVVEIVHLSGTADVMWEDGKMDFVRSTDLVNIIDERMLINLSKMMDFVYSRKIQRPMGEVYAVVQRTDLTNKSIYLRVLTTELSPKQVSDNFVLNNTDVIPHPRYQYFNETNSIAVMQYREQLRIGHIQRTNFYGKVCVRWIDTKREEWCWPTQCSLFIVRGFDLQCIINLVNDMDEENCCPALRFHKVLDKLKSVKEIWESWENFEDGVLAETIESLKYSFAACLNAEKSAGIPEGTYFSYERFCTTKSKLTALISSEEVNYRQPELVEVMKECFQYLYTSAKNLSQHLDTHAQVLEEWIGDGSSTSGVSSSTNSTESSPVEMEVDEIGDAGTNTNVIVQSRMFDSSVVMEDTIPTSHTYISQNFEPEQYQVFLKIIRNEMSNFRDSYAPGIKVRAFANRMDLFSVAICGPQKTPYENTLCLFDTSFPSKYPAIPPNVNFLPYGAGRLNPNLYAEGKVCLSLLGTWQGRHHGENWTKESNLLQVLVSIQGLILVSEPYHNEPGQEAGNYTQSDKKSRCRVYNSQLMPKICSMMLTQIQNPGKPWDDDIYQFYLENLPKFLARWRKWIEVAAKMNKEEAILAELADEEKPGFEIYPLSSTLVSSMKHCIASLANALKNLEARQS